MVCSGAGSTADELTLVVYDSDDDDGGGGDDDDDDDDMLMMMMVIRTLQCKTVVLVCSVVHAVVTVVAVVFIGHQPPDTG